MAPSRVVVDAARGLEFGLSEAFGHGDLLLALTYREFRARYAQTVLGVSWALLQPLATLAVLALVFGRAVRVETGGTPYPLFASVGLVAWGYCSFVIQQAGQSLVAAQDIVTKVYFPRVLIPASKALVGLVDLGLSLALVVGLMAWYRIPPTGRVFLVPLLIGLLISASLGVGLWLSALTIRFRDFHHVLPFLVQFGLYVSPVAYPASAAVAHAPGWLAWVYFLNPVAGLVEALRWALLATGALRVELAVSVMSSLALLLGGIGAFRRVERTIADLI